MKGRHGTVTDPSVCASNILNQMLGSNQVSDTPAGGIECLTGGSHGQSALVELWRQSGDSSEGDVVETVVYFVGKNDKVVLNTELTNTFEFSLREDLPNRVVTVSQLAICRTGVSNVTYGEFSTW